MYEPFNKTLMKLLHSIFILYYSQFNLKYFTNSPSEQFSQYNQNPITYDIVVSFHDLYSQIYKHVSN